MAGTTPINAIPYPTGTDAPDITAEFAAVAGVVDSRMVSRFISAAARNAAVPSPIEGQFAYLTTEDLLTFYDGTAWVPYGNAKVTIKQASELDTTYTLQDDDHLKFYAKANSVYHVSAILFPVSTNTTNDRGLQITWSFPSGATFKRILQGPKSTGVAVVNAGMNARVTFTTSALTAGYSAGSSSSHGSMVEEDLVVTTGVTAGYVTLRFCQHASAPGGLTGSMRTSSHIRVRKVS